MPKKVTSTLATMKCTVRADCCPFRMVTIVGNTEVIAGDIAKPVQIMIGDRTKTTVKYVSR